MQAVTTLGLDIAKSVFQVHGIDTEGKVIIRQAPLRPGVFSEVAAMPSWDRGLYREKATDDKRKLVLNPRRNRNEN